MLHDKTWFLTLNPPLKNGSRASEMNEDCRYFTVNLNYFDISIVYKWLETSLRNFVKPVSHFAEIFGKLLSQIHECFPSLAVKWKAIMTGNFAKVTMLYPIQSFARRRHRAVPKIAATLQLLSSYIAIHLMLVWYYNNNCVFGFATKSLNRLWRKLCCTVQSQTPVVGGEKNVGGLRNWWINGMVNCNLRLVWNLSLSCKCVDEEKKQIN